MSSIYGERMKLSIFGQSHGAAIGMVLDGVPAGLPVDLNELQLFLRRRAPGNTSYSSARSEADVPQFLSGIVDGYTCGAPISAIIVNQDARTADYNAISDCPRPGHADLTAQIKYRGYQDRAGGGHFSGRLTAPLCIAGGLCKQWLAQNGIHVGAHIAEIAGIADQPEVLDWLKPDLSRIGSDFPVINSDAGIRMREAIAAAYDEGDSVGGVICCFATGVPAGLGEPIFGGIESRIAQIVYGIPAVKGLDFGSGFSGCSVRGSRNNDAYTVNHGNICGETNHAGGILGGITTGLPIVFRVAIKPTPTIAKPQQTVNLSTMCTETLQISGRHDPCIVPRAVPVVESAAAIALLDSLLVAKGEIL